MKFVSILFNHPSRPSQQFDSGFDALDHITLGRKPAVSDFIGGHLIGQLVHNLGIDKGNLQIRHMSADGVQDLAHGGVNAEHVIDPTIEQPGFDRMNNNAHGVT